MIGKLSQMISVVQTGVTILEKYWTQEWMVHSCSKIVKWHDVFDEILDADITAEEVKAAIRHLKNGKATGPDGIISEILKAAEDSLVPFLVKYFNKLFKEGSFPTEWTKAFIVPLHKKGDPNDTDNYSGISLLSVLGKVFTFILNKCLTEWTDSNDVLSDAPAGFRMTQQQTTYLLCTLVLKSIC